MTIFKMITHHSVMTSSLFINSLIIDKFCIFLSVIDYNSKTDVFRDVIYVLFTQCELRRPMDASGGSEVYVCRAALAFDARLYMHQPYLSI